MDAHRLSDARLEVERYLPKIAIRSRRSAQDGLIFAFTDILVMFAAFAAGRVASVWYVGYVGQDGPVRALMPNPDDLVPLMTVFAMLAGALLISFRRLGHYSRRRPVWQEVGDVLSFSIAAGVVNMALVFLLKADVSRLWMVITWALVVLMIPLSRFALKHTMMQRGKWIRSTVVVGTGRNAQDTAYALTSNPMLGYRIEAFLAPRMEGCEPPESIEIDGRDIPVYSLDIRSGLLPLELGRPHVTIAFEMEDMARCDGLIEKLNLYYGDVDLVSPMRGLPLNNTKVTHFFGHDILALRLYNNLSRPWPQVMKRAFDIVAGTCLLVVASPLMAVIAIRLYREGGPIFFSHTRVGFGGRPFKCHKFRSMVPDAADRLADLLARDPQAREEWERDRKLKDDPRVTPTGNFLRRTSMDELPQIWNVLCGEMSLVGPRPITRDELLRYGDDAVYYIETRPGLTGLWQVSGRNDVDYEQRVHLDGWYVKNWNLWYDLVILMQTALVVLRKRGAY